MKTTDRGPFGRVLLDWREQRGFTQGELARKTGLDVSSIGAYERGERRPKGEKLARLCVALGIEPATFWDKVAQAETDELKPLVEKVRREMGEEAPEEPRDPDLEPYSQAWDLCSDVWKDMFLLAARVSRGSGDPGHLDALVKLFAKVNQSVPVVSPPQSKPSGDQG
ncbi:MAG TPA: helix-turn-helix transcriptional regulator [Thermoanaerobaculia bacterium]|nr:helix-turn-helix transcriptional regulator [Thermoanaerobaculia bacterium]